MFKIYTYVPAVCLLLLLCSCVREKVVVPYEINSIEFISDDMVFEGSNTLQVSYKLSLAEALGMETLTDDQIKKVKLVKATLVTEDSLHFNTMNSIVLNISSEKTDMTQVAVVNPIPENMDQLNMTVAEEQEIADAFKQKNIYLIADTDMKQDLTRPVRFKVNLTFELTIKK